MSQAMPSRMSCSLTIMMSVESGTRSTSRSRIEAGADHVGATGMHERQGPAIRDGHLHERQARLAYVVEVEPGAANRCRVVRRQGQRVRRHGRDRAGDAHEGADRFEVSDNRGEHPVEMVHARGHFGDPDAGSLDRNRSVRRTDPTSSDTDHSMSSPVPTTSSVDPPPMSTTSVRACSRSRVAPTIEARASSSPASTTGRTPRMPSIASSNSAALSASRTADVAKNPPGRRRTSRSARRTRGWPATYAQSPPRRGVSYGRRPGRGGRSAFLAPGRSCGGQRHH